MRLSYCQRRGKQGGSETIGTHLESYLQKNRVNYKQPRGKEKMDHEEREPGPKSKLKSKGGGRKRDV